MTSKAKAKRPHNATAEQLAPDHAWERQPNEPDRAWDAFVAYRDMGPGERSFSRLVQKCNKTGQNFAVWSVKWSWVARCQQFDSWRDKMAKQVEIAEIQEMRRRHIQIAMSLQGAAALALNKIIKAEQAGTQLTLRPNEMKDLAELGLRIERLNRGEPTENTKQDVSINTVDATVQSITIGGKKIEF